MGDGRVLTKDDWLGEAMELLRSQGVGGVRILTLAKSLQVSRGSFYWHFRDRRDLLDHMLDWWDRQMTDTVIEFTRTGESGPERVTFRTAALLRRLLGREPPEPGDALAPNFVHCFTRDELISELQEAGWQLARFEQEPYPHAVAKAVSPP